MATRITDLIKRDNGGHSFMRPAGNSVRCRACGRSYTYELLSKQGTPTCEGEGGN